ARRRASAPPRPRSPSGRSAGSPTAPFLPRGAHSTATPAPASERRASVPPHASDSSSGWAKTARTSWPASSFSDMAGLRNIVIDALVLPDHPIDAKPRDGALADAEAIEREDAR